MTDIKFIYLCFKRQIDYLVYIVGKLQQKGLELLLVQAQVQYLKVILQPYFFLNVFKYKFLILR